MNRYQMIKKIAKHYGFKNQGIKLSEEAAELSAAMSKLLTGEGGRLAVISEIADVTIMIEQVQYLMGIDKCEILDTMEYKLNRQLERISDGSNNNDDKLSLYMQLYDKARAAQARAEKELYKLQQQHKKLERQLHKAQCGT